MKTQTIPIRVGRPTGRWRAIRRGVAAATVAVVLLTGACGAEISTEPATETNTTAETSTDTAVEQPGDAGTAAQPAPDDGEDSAAQPPPSAPTPTPVPLDVQSALTNPEPTEDTLVVPILDQPLAPGMTSDEVLGVVASIMGPTDDLAGDLNRFGPFVVPLPTLANTEVVSLDLISTRGVLESGSEVAYNFGAGFITSATRQDAILAIQTELAAAGWTVETGEVTQGDIGFSTLTAELSNGSSPLKIDLNFSDRQEGGSIGALSHITRIDDPDDAFAAAEGWSGDAPIPIERTLRGTRFRIAGSEQGNYDISIETDYGDLAGPSPEEAASEVAAGFAGSSWILDDTSFSSNGLTVWAEYRGLSGVLSVTQYDSGEIVLAVRADGILAAPVPVSPYTRGTGLTAAADDESATSPADTTESVLAEPNGPALNASMGRQQVEDFLISLLGPTDDIAGTMARLGDFPAAVTTMPDSIIANVSFTLGTNAEQSSENPTTRSGTTLDFLTTASPEDAVLALQSDLVAGGFKLNSAGNEERNDRVEYFAALVDPNAVTATNINITAYSQANGVTLVIVRYVRVAPGWEQADAATGWYGSRPFPDGGLLTGTHLIVAYRLGSAETATVSMQTIFWFEGFEERGLRDEMIARAEAPDWTFVEETEDAIKMALGDLDEPVRFTFNPKSDNPQNFLVYGNVLTAVPLN